MKGTVREWVGSIHEMYINSRSKQKCCWDTPPTTPMRVKCLSIDSVCLVKQVPVWRSVPILVLLLDTSNENPWDGVTSDTLSSSVRLHTSNLKERVYRRRPVNPRDHTRRFYLWYARDDPWDWWSDPSIKRTSGSLKKGYRTESGGREWWRSGLSYWYPE